MTQLIPGKWYDFRGENDSDKVAAQFDFSHIGIGDKEYFNFTGFIRKKDGFQLKKGNWYMPRKIKEFPPEELNKYLPEHLKINLQYEIY